MIKRKYIVRSINKVKYISSYNKYEWINLVV